MHYREVLKLEKDKLDVYLGYNNEGHLKVNLEDYPSIIITGETGTGKSILLDQIVVQLLRTHTSHELGLMTIDTSGVELNYYKSSPALLLSAENDMKKIQVVISRTLKEIERRRKLFADAKVSTIQEYNKVSPKKLPSLVLAIDDDRRLLNEPDMANQITAIISSLNRIGIYFILVTNDVYNDFFQRDNNLYGSLLISFDLAESEAARYVNIEEAEHIGVGLFKAKKKYSTSIYNTYGFDDHIITETVQR